MTTITNGVAPHRFLTTHTSRQRHGDAPSYRETCQSNGIAMTQ
jgi:hypothetical protein